MDQSMKLAVVLGKPPYRDSKAEEAIRYVEGGINNRMDVILFLVDEGVLLAKKGEAEENRGYRNIGNRLKDFIHQGGKVLVERLSLKEYGIERDDILEGVSLENGYEISEKLKESDKILIV